MKAAIPTKLLPRIPLARAWARRARPGWLLAGLLTATAAIPVVASPAFAPTRLPMASPEEARDDIALVWTSSAVCSGREQFVGELRRRVPARGWRLAPEGPVQVGFEEDGSRIKGTLLVALADGTQLRREIVGADCAEAVEALALIAAIALDPEAARPVEVRSQSSADSAGESPLPERDSSATPPDGPSVEARDGGVEWGAAFVARGSWGPGPRPLLGAGAVLDSRSPKPGWWAPSLRGTVSFQVRGNFEQTLGTATFSRLALDLDLCPSQLNGSQFRVRACAAAEAGVVWAEGTQTFDPRRIARPWLAGGLALVADLELAGAMGLTLRASGTAPAVRDTFLFDDQAFHEVPPLVATVGGGLRIAFP